MDAVSLLEGSSLRAFLIGRGWVWPGLETCHLFGLTLLMGTLVIVDLRILGFAPQLPLAGAHSLIPLAVLGGAINGATGAMLVLGDPAHFLGNPVFQMKMVLVASAGLNAVMFNTWLRAQITDGVVGPWAKASAALSLALWVAVTLAARFIAYVE